MLVHGVAFALLHLATTTVACRSQLPNTRLATIPGLLMALLLYSMMRFASGGAAGGISTHSSIYSSSLLTTTQMAAEGPGLQSRVVDCRVALIVVRNPASPKAIVIVNRLKLHRRLDKVCAVSD